MGKPNSMRIEDFLIASRKTMPPDASLEMDLYHGSVGIATEIYELKKAFTVTNQVEEIGDAFFYLALIHKRYKFVIAPGQVSSDSKDYIMHLLDITVAELLDAVKTHNEYGRDTKIDIQRACSRIATYLCFFAQELGYTIEKIMFINFMKLQGPDGRFEEGFSSEKANNRDLEKESKILEDNS